MLGATAVADSDSIIPEYKTNHTEDNDSQGRVAVTDTTTQAPQILDAIDPMQ